MAISRLASAERRGSEDFAFRVFRDDGERRTIENFNFFDEIGLIAFMRDKEPVWRRIVQKYHNSAVCDYAGNSGTTGTDGVINLNSNNSAFSTLNFAGSTLSGTGTITLGSPGSGR